MIVSMSDEVGHAVVSAARNIVPAVIGRGGVAHCFAKLDPMRTALVVIGPGPSFRRSDSRA
jgi:hypothetical protein